MDNTPARKTGPREVFLHLIAIISLYFSAGSFLTLIFQYINIWFPDPLEGVTRFGNYGSIRFAISSLIVVFPVYLLTTRYLNKIYDASPEIRQMRLRRWLVYFTLFVAALVIIGDLVSLVNGFLSGGLTARFALKVVAVFFVAGSVFYYYFYELKRARAQ